jgi:nitrile hydratase subunit beta
MDLGGSAQRRRINESFDYFKFRYYEKWLGGISGYFVAKGYITQAELDARTKTFLTSFPVMPKGGDAAVDARVRKYLLIGDDPKRQRSAPPRFAAGDAVRVADSKSVDHTRLPGHLRSKPGTIDSVYPDAYSYLCDTGADGIGEPIPVYCVKFDPEALWPGNTEDNFTFYADLFETYLEPAIES